MGRYTGWIAIEAGIAGGADITLVPEFPINIDEVCETLRLRHGRGKSFSIIVVSEGATIVGYEHAGEEHQRTHKLGRIGELLAELIEKRTGYETRVSVLGNIQRGGSPTSYDRVIATRYGFKAVDMVCEKKFGKMVAFHDGKIRSVNIADAVRTHKTIDLELYDIVKAFSAS